MSPGNWLPVVINQKLGLNSISVMRKTWSKYLNLKKKIRMILFLFFIKQKIILTRVDGLTYNSSWIRFKNYDIETKS